MLRTTSLDLQLDGQRHVHQCCYPIAPVRTAQGGLYPLSRMSAALARRILALVAVPVAALSITACGVTHENTAMPLDRPTATVAPPAGWLSVQYQGVSLATPSSYDKVDGSTLGAGCGSELRDTLILGHLPAGQGCASPTIGTEHEVAWVQPYVGSGYDLLRSKDSQITEVGGSYAWSRHAEEGSFVVVVPSRDVVLSFSKDDDVAQSILRSVSWS
jgi:hypothetical protein